VLKQKMNFPTGKYFAFSESEVLVWWKVPQHLCLCCQLKAQLSPILTKPSLDKNKAQFWFGEKAKFSCQAKFHLLIKVLLLKQNFTVLEMFCFLLVNSLFQ